jgi:hypothetical protein
MSGAAEVVVGWMWTSLFESLFKSITMLELERRYPEFAFFVTTK